MIVPVRRSRTLRSFPPAGCRRVIKLSTWALTLLEYRCGIRDGPHKAFGRGSAPVMVDGSAWTLGSPKFAKFNSGPLKQSVMSGGPARWPKHRDTPHSHPAFTPTKLARAKNIRLREVS